MLKTPDESEQRLQRMKILEVKPVYTLSTFTVSFVLTKEVDDFLVIV